MVATCREKERNGEFYGLANQNIENVRNLIKKFLRCDKARQNVKAGHKVIKTIMDIGTHTDTRQ
jgi:hypothetical protein